MARVLSLRLWVSCLLFGLAGCGGGVPTTTMVDDVFHAVYLRGAPADTQSRRVTLTIEGPDRCTDAVLTAAAQQDPPLILDVVVSSTRLATAGATPSALTAVMTRVVGDGHGLTLGLDTLPSDWRRDPAAMRQGLADQTRDVEARLAALGISTPALRAWRPPSADANTLRAGAAADRPIVLWSLRAPSGDAFQGALPSLLERLSDGDIVALPGADPRPDADGCPVADAVPAVAATLAAAELKTVRLETMLGPRLTRFEPPRVVRYRGPPPAAGCADSGPTGDSARWALVHRTRPGALLVQPLGIAESSTVALLGARAEIERAWGERTRWIARPGCLRTVAPDRLESPVAGDDGMRWWVVGDGRVERRDPRAIGRPGRPVLLPDRADLARFEARQRVPWPVRGVVAGALQNLGLDVPLLTESRATVAMVIGADLDADADVVAIRRAVAAYVPVAELSMGEYLFLADGLPEAAEALRRTARAAEGFLRPGPVMLLGAPGAGPDPTRLSIGGEAALPAPPIDLIRQVLAAGHRLRAGDVVAAAPAAPRGAPVVFPAGEADSVGNALRASLGRSLLVAMMLPIYLRPGATRHYDGDLLGQSHIRLAVPAGVAAPAVGARPLVEDDAPPMDGTPASRVEPAPDEHTGTP